MLSLFEQSAFFGITLSIAMYLVGIELKKKFKFALFNPLLIAITLTISIILVLGIDLQTYTNSAATLSWLLTPSTICLAIPLYQQIDLLRKYWSAIGCALISGVLTSFATIYCLCLLFNLDHSTFVTLLPKSISTAIGMGISEEFGGYVTITVAIIILTGVLGNIFAEFMFKLFKIKHPIAKGIGLGSCAHAIGAAKAMELGKIEGAMASLSIAMAGLITVLLAPFFVGLI